MVPRKRFLLRIVACVLGPLADCGSGTIKPHAPSVGEFLGMEI